MQSIASVRLNQLIFDLDFWMYMGDDHSSVGLKVKVIGQGQRPSNFCQREIARSHVVLPFAMLFKRFACIL